MPRSLYQNTVMVKGPVGAIPLAGAAVEFREPNGTPISYPLYPDGVATTPLVLPYVTGNLGELEVWAERPHRVQITVTKGGLTQAQETIDLEYPPEYSATTEDVAEAIEDHEAKENPHPQYLTQDEGDERYLPVSYVPPVFDGYTKSESELRYINTTGDTMSGVLAFTARAEFNSGLIVNSGDVEFYGGDVYARSDLFVTGALTLNGQPVLNQSQSDLRYEQLTKKGAANGYVPLDAGAKIPNTYLPDLAITQTFVVVSQAEMLALPAQTGDVAVRLDTSENYILAADPATVLANWTKLAASTIAGNTTVIRREEFTPAASSTSVNLTVVPTTLLSVVRNGVEQSGLAGHYSVAGVTVTFTDVFAAGERVSIMYEMGAASDLEARLGAALQRIAALEARLDG